MPSKKPKTVPQPVGDLPIYNCHIHTFTKDHVPDYFLNLMCTTFLGSFFGGLFASILGGPLNWLLLRPGSLLPALIWVLKYINPFSESDAWQRWANFFITSEIKTQEEVLARIQEQYPPSTRFVVLPMDMKFMKLGNVPETIDQQHATLLRIAEKSQGRVIPFYAADPRRDDVVERVHQNLGPDKFRGLKIYPNLGYFPNDPKLMDVYAICEERGYPVMSHCNIGGIYEYGFTEQDRKARGCPENYIPILEKYPNLRLCLAHFGGNDEWERHLQIPTAQEGADRTWIKMIADMIRCGKYLNLYTDISYTIFARKPRGMYIDYFDYLKVLLAHPRLHDRVLFGSDYYVVQREPMTEKQVSISLRSRLGEDLYFQIAHYNPVAYLGVV